MISDSIWYFGYRIKFSDTSGYGGQRDNLKVKEVSHKLEESIWLSPYSMINC